MVIYPFTRGHDKAITALRKYAPDALTFNVSNSHEAYYDLLASLWGREELIIIEHDIVVDEFTLPSMHQCLNDWCCTPYQMASTELMLYASLGCTKFSPEFQCAVPISEACAVPFYDFRCPSPHCWYALDVQIQRLAANRGFLPCNEHEPVEHILRPGQIWNGCGRHGA